MHIGNVLPGMEPFGDLQQLVFAHAVNQQVGPAVHQDGAAHLITPIIIMGQAAKTGFHPADDDRHSRVCLADQVAVDNCGPIRTQPGLTPGRIHILPALVFIGRIMAYHAIQVAPGYREKQTRLSQAGYVLQIAPVGLGDYTHPIAFGLHKPAQQGGSPGRVINIGITADYDYVQFIPAAGFQIRPADW
ncbi:MAG: hypothetical protein BWY71_01863 [Planctomycetes bacterium ADurb.Bin412]|nr:MAG: hypothetical protein BWY71_01863 [Planctomycetes bacterium ADurb.Bin412]